MKLRIEFFCAFLFAIPAVVSPGNTGPEGKGVAGCPKDTGAAASASPVSGRLPIHLPKWDISGGTIVSNSSYPMPVFRPDPKIDYKIMVMVPNPNIDYKIRVVIPNVPRTYDLETSHPPVIPNLPVIPSPPAMPNPPAMPRFLPRLK